MSAPSLEARNVAEAKAVLTRRGSLTTKLRALDLGVDDNLTMPFSPEELLARAIVVSQARPVAQADTELAARLRQLRRSGCE